MYFNKPSDIDLCVHTFTDTALEDLPHILSAYLWLRTCICRPLMVIFTTFRTLMQSLNIALAHRACFKWPNSSLLTKVVSRRKMYVVYINIFYKMVFYKYIHCNKATADITYGVFLCKIFLIFMF